jgi:hypothetical protein
MRVRRLGVPGPVPSASRGPATGWRATLRRTGDLALVGVVTVLGCVPLVTVGASLAVASAAVHHWCEHDELPPARALARAFVRALLPGLAASAGLLGVTALLLVDLAALRGGRAPGGAPAMALTTACALLVMGASALVVVLVGVQGGRGWARAARRAVSAICAAPLVLLAAAGVVGLVALMAWLLPASAPVLPGYALFALHVVVRRSGAGGAAGAGG